MKTWKILISALWVGLFSLATAGAQYDKESFQTISSSDLNFQAQVVDGKVEMSWNAFEKSKEYGFSYYKVVRSFEKNNPYYPEDGYISYISDINATSYVDADMYAKKAYYRVCAIAYDKGKYRFCSNVVSVTKNDVQETKKIETPQKDIQKKSSWWEMLSKKIQTQLDNLFQKYKNKIEKNFTTDEEKIKIINKVIEWLSANPSSEKQKLYIDYLIKKFKDYKDSLSEWISEIDSLIDGLLEK